MVVPMLSEKWSFTNLLSKQLFPKQPSPSRMTWNTSGTVELAATAILDQVNTTENWRGHNVNGCMIEVMCLVAQLTHPLLALLDQSHRMWYHIIDDTNCTINYESKITNNSFSQREQGTSNTTKTNWNWNWKWSEIKGESCCKTRLKVLW